MFYYNIKRDRKYLFDLKIKKEQKCIKIYILNHKYVVKKEK